MAFGQSSGPPANGKQVAELLALVQAAGHTDFRDARGPLGLNQRQAAGKFTRDEVDVLIAQLQDAEHAEPPAPVASTVAPRAVAKAAAVKPSTSTEAALRKLSSEVLAAELQRRGWVVMEP